MFRRATITLGNCPHSSYDFCGFSSVARSPLTVCMNSVFTYIQATIVACGDTHTSRETGIVVLAKTAYRALETETTVR